MAATAAATAAVAFSLDQEQEQEQQTTNTLVPFILPLCCWTENNPLSQSAIMETLMTMMLSLIHHQVNHPH